MTRDRFMYSKCACYVWVLFIEEGGNMTERLRFMFYAGRV
jgi:hypothetical protein